MTDDLNDKLWTFANDPRIKTIVIWNRWNKGNLQWWCPEYWADCGRCPLDVHPLPLVQYHPKNQKQAKARGKNLTKNSINFSCLLEQFIYSIMSQHCIRLSTVIWGGELLSCTFLTNCVNKELTSNPLACCKIDLNTLEKRWSHRKHTISCMQSSSRPSWTT